MIYRVFEVKSSGRERKVWEGEVDPDIIAGRGTLQARPFGRLYCQDGRVLQSDDRQVPIRGVTCRFEQVA